MSTNDCPKKKRKPEQQHHDDEKLAAIKHASTARLHHFRKSTVARRQPRGGWIAKSEETLHLSSGDLSGPDNDDVFYADSNEPPALRTSEKQMRTNARTCYVRRGWDSVPVVVEQYRLIFFTTPKVQSSRFRLRGIVTPRIHRSVGTGIPLSCGPHCISPWLYGAGSPGNTCPAPRCVRYFQLIN